MSVTIKRVMVIALLFAIIVIALCGLECKTILSVSLSLSLSLNALSLHNCPQSLFISHTYMSNCVYQTRVQ